MSGGTEENPEPEQDDERPELDNLNDPEGATLEDDLISVIEIGPTQFSEAGYSKPQAQRAIRFYTDEESDEALERETNKNSTARLVDGLMKRVGERHSLPRGRGRKSPPTVTRR